MSGKGPIIEALERKFGLPPGDLREPKKPEIPPNEETTLAARRKFSKPAQRIADRLIGGEISPDSPSGRDKDIEALGTFGRIKPRRQSKN